MPNQFIKYSIWYPIVCLREKKNEKKTKTMDTIWISDSLDILWYSKWFHLSRWSHLILTTNIIFLFAFLCADTELRANTHWFGHIYSAEEPKMMASIEMVEISLFTMYFILNTLNSFNKHNDILNTFSLVLVLSSHDSRD